MNINFEVAESFASSLHKIDAAGLRKALEISDDEKEIDSQKLIDFLISKQSEKLKLRDDAGYQRAEKKILSGLEKDLRTEFNVSDDDTAELKGLDLIKHIVEAVKAEPGKGGKSKLTDDEIKKHPIYLELEKSKITEVKKVQTEFETKIKEITDGQEYEKLLTDVERQALQIFTEMGDAILPEEKSIAEKHVNKLLIGELKGYKFQKNGDDILVLNPDGTRKEDKAGNAVTLKDLTQDVAKSNFQFKVSQKRENTGNGGKDDKDQGGGKGAKKYTGAAPKTGQEYVELLLQPDLTPDIKAEIKETYGAQFTNN